MSQYIYKNPDDTVRVSIIGGPGGEWGKNEWNYDAFFRDDPTKVFTYSEVGDLFPTFSPARGAVAILNPQRDPRYHTFTYK